MYKKTQKLARYKRNSRIIHDYRQEFKVGKLYIKNHNSILDVKPTG